MKDRDLGQSHQSLDKLGMLQLTSEKRLTGPGSPIVNWTDLPIARRKGRKPHFGLEEILLHQEKTVRANCQFETIQQFLRESRGYVIPKTMADQFSLLQKWQLVVPTHVDVAQPLFLGIKEDDRDYIAIDDAQATIYAHRGADGGSTLDGGKYVLTWVELAGVFNDSNGSPRIVATNYNWDGLERTECALASVNVSFSENEYKRGPTVFDAFIPTAVEIANYEFGIIRTTALTTQAMIDSLPTPHRLAINLLTNPKGGLFLHEIGTSRRSNPTDFDQGISLVPGDKTVTIGFNKLLNGINSWNIEVPRTFDHVAVN